jgi:hypothetical protein
MNVCVNGIEVSVSDSVIAKLLTERLVKPACVKNEVRQVRADNEPPRIGELWWPMQGGIYAGVGRAADGTQHQLVVGPAAPNAMTWKDALAWAAALREDGFDDWQLPTRRDQALCYANVPELFEKEWYWSCEQCAGDDAFAWCQSFGYGGQLSNPKGNECRARAVRRLTL